MSRVMPLVLAVIPLVVGPLRAHAQVQPDSASHDSTLGGFLGELSDSTDRWFGMVTGPVDTAGLDSALAWGLVHPAAGDRRRLAVTPTPWLAFSRVDGPFYGGRLSIGQPRDRGALSGRLGWAAGPNDWLGGGEYRKSWGGRPRGSAWALRIAAGRQTWLMDPDRRESALNGMRALVSGADRQHYLRRQGQRVTLERETEDLRVAVGYRDERELPTPTTATWNLTHRIPAVSENLPAALGRARELQLLATMRVPGTPAWIEAEARVSDPAIGSDFDYRRWRVAAAAELPVGSVATFVPQATWGRLAGDTLPQASFYFGGTSSVRSVRSSSVGGTGKAFARADLIAARDLLSLIRLKHPDALALNAGVFGAIGAIWGPDPLGGPGSAPGDWPEREAWLPEAGVEVLYRPGVPEPYGWFRFEVAWPLGPAGRDPRIAVSYSRMIDLLRVVGP